MRALPYSDKLEVGTVKITIQQFYLPNGDSTQNRGVISDISLPSANMFLFDGESDLDNALSWDHISPIIYQLPERSNPDFALVQNNLLETLSTKSRLRQDQSEEFAFLKENIAWYKERHDMKYVSLNLEERRKEKEQLEEIRDRFEDIRDKLSEQLTYEVEPVKLDLTKLKEEAHQEKLVSTPLPGGRERANQFYQKVFYYQAAPGEKIHEIWVEYFDYDKALEESEALAALLQEATGIEFSEADTREILTRFKNKDRGTDFNVIEPFTAVLGEDIDEAVLLEAMPALFTRLVEIDPDILLERSKLDIPLRESLRIVRDWIEVDSPLNPTRIAGNVVSIDDETEDTAATP